ncbi:MAG: hypothetical protein P8O03_09735 [Ilumatobacter sp.]|nr:hypothetical protein [Ilumatobacter sp.]MDG2040603.1 hypothetical protein [Ilumatobacter sp.]NKB39754.1 hypothetical protein [Ilumatobacter sp.]
MRPSYRIGWPILLVGAQALVSEHLDPFGRSTAASVANPPVTVSVCVMGDAPNSPQHGD